MAERTITIGSVSMEWRMIGWRIGWLAGPPAIASELGAGPHLQRPHAGRHRAGRRGRGARASRRTRCARASSEWQRRRDAVLEQLAGYPAIRADGGWSLLLDTRAMGIDPADASSRLLAERVAATPMAGWGGEVAARHLRLVFSNEPVERLALLGERVAPRSARRRGPGATGTPPRRRRRRSARGSAPRA